MKLSRAHGQINDIEYRYVERVFEFDNKIAKRNNDAKKQRWKLLT